MAKSQTTGEASGRSLEDHEIRAAMTTLKGVIEHMRTLSSHRSLSLAATKIEEAVHWLRNRRESL